MYITEPDILINISRLILGPQNYWWWHGAVKERCGNCEVFSQQMLTGCLLHSWAHWGTFPGLRELTIGMGGRQPLGVC